ncbi:hypothetical protein [Afipia felis]|uniref:7-cyano-7-deazaguanine synthase n=2 Tax=Afipia felis TaxID=1035 RepID=A0A380W964_AFIFE|nr:hypothetical protein [Afipia felis]EKS28678.1 hypothetical protein HMPREF9697_01206 [Afipia felis ATCC 53690]SUU77385.1 Uncharacterised protein [Afipia felis]SUU85452.1 Uncharacterised protein [Afipia felis]
MTEIAPLPVYLEEWTPRRIAVRVDKGSAENSFYFQSPADLWPSAPPATLDFAAVALAQFASSQGRDLHIHGLMTRTQARNLERFIEIWSVWRPDRYRPINVLADGWQHASEPSSFDSAVLAFSGGVDATATLILHNDRKLSSAMPRVGLGVFVGGLDVSNEDQSGQRTAFSSAQGTLSAFNAEAAFVSTNWRDHFCPNWDDGHSSILSGVMRTFEQKCGAGIIASDASYLEDLSVGLFGNHMAMNYLLGSSSFAIFQGGGTLTRVERVREICSYSVALKNLRVCYQSHAKGRNCGRCKKCIFTRMAVVACGHEPHELFDTEFDAEDVERITIGIHGWIYLNDILNHLPQSDPHHSKLWALRERESEKFVSTKHPSLTGKHRSMFEEISECRARISEMENSKSWRITRPLRALGF